MRLRGRGEGDDVLKGESRPGGAARGGGRAAPGGWGLRPYPGRPRRWAWEAGQGLVEAAVALPPVLIVAAALVQLALYAHAQHVVVAAVQDGARIASGEGRALDEGYGHAQALLRAGLVVRNAHRTAPRRGGGPPG